MAIDIGNIPITDGGQLVPDAGMLVFGYMMHPNCGRSAHQLARIIAEETIAKAKDPNYLLGHIFNAQMKDTLISRLLLCGQVALRVCRNYSEEGTASFSMAAHVVSELNSTNVTADGKSLPTDETRLRKTFASYRASIHFWAAANNAFKREDGSLISGLEAVNEMQVSQVFLGEFLSVAKQIEEILEVAKPCDFYWSAAETGSEIWDFRQFPKATYKAETVVAQQATQTYVTRPKG